LTIFELVQFTIRVKTSPNSMLQRFFLRVASTSYWRTWRPPELGIHSEMNKQSRTADKEWFSGRGLGGNLINPNRKNWHVRKFWNGTRAWTDSLERP